LEFTLTLMTFTSIVCLRHWVGINLVILWCYFNSLASNN